jgi:hypothetical protein
VGLTADFGGYYRRINIEDFQVSASAHTFMFGPTITIPTESQFKPFLRILAGMAWASGERREGSGRRVRVVDSLSTHAFVGTIGGGFDIKINQNFAVRVIDIDYLPAHHHSGETIHNIRWRSGIVVSFGH